MSSVNTGAAMVFSRPCIRLALPRNVLISPLWAIMRNGWASRQLGNVFVLYRWWTMAKAVRTRWSERSG